MFFWMSKEDAERRTQQSEEWKRKKLSDEQYAVIEDAFAAAIGKKAVEEPKTSKKSTT
jgi:hypothetical protein